jgi:hypothetical protein
MPEKTIKRRLLGPANRDYMFAECVASDDPRLKEK